VTPPTARIALRGLRAYGRHGVSEAERAHPQPFDVDVCLEVDADRARSSDEIGDTIDYAALGERVRHVVETTSYALIERLAQEILDDVLRDGRVASARVTVAKPHALAGATPSVTLAAARMA
jgi:dihydroneopterin aldolase